MTSPFGLARGTGALRAEASRGGTNFFSGALLTLTDRFLLAVFFVLAFFFAAGFFLLIFLAAFFLATGFFLLIFLAAFFLATDFFLLIFLAAFFLAAGFFLATFFAVFFFTAIFFLLALFRAGAFFLLAVFRLAAVFLAGVFLATAFLRAVVCLRFLFAAFFAGISGSCRGKKRPGLYMAGRGMEAIFFTSVFGLSLTAKSPVNTGLGRKLSFFGDNRFIAGFPLHLPTFTG